MLLAKRWSLKTGKRQPGPARGVISGVADLSLGDQPERGAGVEGAPQTPVCNSTATRFIEQHFRSPALWSFGILGRVVRHLGYI